MPKSGSDDVHRYLHALFDAGTVAGLTDGELLERFSAGRGEAAELAFTALVARHGPMVLCVSRNVLRDAHDAEDAFQATFLVLARTAGSVRRRNALGPYLHGIALRVAACARLTKAWRLRHKRRCVEQVPRSFVVPEVDGSARVVHEELGRLPARFQGVAVLCDLEGKTYAEAARLLGCPIGTVMSRLSEARRRLRRGLARRGLVPAAGAIETVLAEEAGATTAAPTRALEEATVQAATHVVGGQAMMAGVVSTAVAALTQGAIKVMFLTRVKTLGASVLTAVALLAVGFTLLAGNTSGGRAPGEPNTAGVVENEPAKARLEKRDDARLRVDGVVVDEQGKPVADASIRLLGSPPGCRRPHDPARRYVHARRPLVGSRLRSAAGHDQGRNGAGPLSLLG